MERRGEVFYVVIMGIAKLSVSQMLIGQGQRKIGDFMNVEKVIS